MLLRHEIIQFFHVMHTHSTYIEDIILPSLHRRPYKPLKPQYSPFHHTILIQPAGTEIVSIKKPLEALTERPRPTDSPHLAAPIGKTPISKHFHRPSQPIPTNLSLRFVAPLSLPFFENPVLDFLIIKEIVMSHQVFANIRTLTSFPTFSPHRRQDPVQKPYENARGTHQFWGTASI